MPRLSSVNSTPAVPTLRPTTSWTIRWNPAAIDSALFTTMRSTTSSIFGSCDITLLPDHRRSVECGPDDANPDPDEEDWPRIPISQHLELIQKKPRAYEQLPEAFPTVRGPGVNNLTRPRRMNRSPQSVSHQKPRGADGKR